MVQNRSLVLTRYLPEGVPVPGRDLVVKTTEIDLEAPVPEGGILLKTNYLSYDPYQLSLMRGGRDSEGSIYELDEPM